MLDQLRNTLAILAVIVCLSSGCGVLDVRDDATAAVEAWAERTAETDPCRIDAMQHCVGGSLAASYCGVPCALTLGVFVEIQQDDGDTMDLHNNEAGAGCSLAINGDTDAAVDCCEALLNSDPPELRTDGECQ